MKKLIQKFILRIIILTILLAAITGLIFYFLIPKQYFDTLPLLLIIFPIISTIVHIQLLKSSQKSLSRFNIAFMLSFMLKMIVYVGLAATIISLETENRMSFIITVLLLYLIYTVFDVKIILDDLKKTNLELKDQT